MTGRRDGGPPWMRAGRRPPWWPDDQPWPPVDRHQLRHARQRMALRFGCFVALAVLLFGSVGTALLWLVLSLLGAVGSAPFARSLSGFGVLLGIVAVVVTAAWLRRLVVPGERLVNAARRIESGDYSARVPVRGPGELRAVARAVNAMSARLEAEEVRRRSVLADVAHELRTPLTIIRGQAEAIADGVYEAEPAQMMPILAATRTLEKLVEDLRTFALAETGSLRLSREPVDMAVLVHETLSGFQPTAEAAAVALVEDLAPDAAAVEGDPARLSSVVANLVSNALRHTAAGGRVRVAARALPAAPAESVELVVADDGEGIAPELLPRVFDRFVKGGTSPGSGLGLAIVRDVVEAHGGAVSLESEPGRGTTVRIVLPRRAPNPPESAEDVRAAPQNGK